MYTVSLVLYIIVYFHDIIEIIKCYQTQNAGETGRGHDVICPAGGAVSVSSVLPAHIILTT